MPQGSRGSGFFRVRFVVAGLTKAYQVVIIKSKLRVFVHMLYVVHYHSLPVTAKPGAPHTPVTIAPLYGFCFRFPLFGFVVKHFLLCPHWTRARRAVYGNNINAADNHSAASALPCVYRSRRIATPSSLVCSSQAGAPGRNRTCKEMPLLRRVRLPVPPLAHIKQRPRAAMR